MYVNKYTGAVATNMFHPTCELQQKHYSAPLQTSAVCKQDFYESDGNSETGFCHYTRESFEMEGNDGGRDSQNLAFK